MGELVDIRKKLIKFKFSSRFAKGYQILNLTWFYYNNKNVNKCLKNKCKPNKFGNVNKNRPNVSRGYWALHTNVTLLNLVMFVFFKMLKSLVMQHLCVTINIC